MDTNYTDEDLVRAVSAVQGGCVSKKKNAARFESHKLLRLAGMTDSKRDRKSFQKSPAMETTV